MLRDLQRKKQPGGGECPLRRLQPRSSAIEIEAHRSAACRGRARGEVPESPAAQVEPEVEVPAPSPAAQVEPEVEVPAPSPAAQVEPEVEVPAPSPAAQVEPEVETAHGLTTDQKRAAIRARMQLHKVQPAIPLSNEALLAVATKLRRDGGTTDRVAAYVVERFAVLRDRAASEKAALAEAERTAGALAEFVAALIEIVRTLCRAALGQSGPESAPRRPTAATEAARADVARDDQAPGGSQAR